MAEECMYYYYDSGYCCALRREKEGYSSIDSDTVHRYCWGSHYDQCPAYRAKHGGSGGCFLTSACVEAKALPDDCHELTLLRSFRDSYLAAQPGGAEEIQEYYRIAPAIVEKIRTSADPASVFEDIYTELVLPCVHLIEQAQNEEAHQLYRSYVTKLADRYLHTKEE